MLGEWATLKIAKALIGMHGLDMTKAERSIAQILIDAGICRFYQDHLIFMPAFQRNN